MPQVDLTSASQFLAALAGVDDAPHTFLAFPEAGADVFPFVRTGTLHELTETLLVANRQGAGVSVVVNETDGSGATYDAIVRPRALFLDIDESPDGAPPDASGRCPLPSFPVTPSLVTTTRRGYHVYWLLSDVPAWDRWERAQASLAQRYGGDPKMADRVKALRVPGFWHHKVQPPIPVQLSACAPDSRLYFDDLLAELRLDITPAKPVTKPTRPDRPAWALEAIERMPQADRVEQYRRWVDEQPPAVEGSGGHDQLVRIIKMAWNFGVEWSYAEGVVEDYNARCQPPWRPRELYAQFNAAGPRGESRGRFDPSSWQSMLWAPEPEVVQREGELPPDVPLPDRDAGGVRRVVRTAPQSPDAPHPAERYRSTIDVGAGMDASMDPDVPHPGDEPRARGHASPSAGSYGRPPAAGSGVGGGPGGGGAGGGGGGEDLHWAGPPVNGHRILSKNSPMISAQMFVRWGYVAGDQKTITAHRRRWYGWDGTCYQQRSREHINRRLYTFSLPAVTWGPKDKKGHSQLVPFNPNQTKVNDMRHALESLTLVDDALAPPCWIGDCDKPQPDPMEIVACKNGLLHLPKRTMLGPRPDFFNMTCLGVEYDPNAPEPAQWLAFLEQLWPDDRESQRLLQEWFGLCLVPDTSFQKALMILGPRRSGKGTIARVLNQLHGEHNSVAWPSLADLVSRFGLEALLDKTVAIMPDLRVSSRLDTQTAIERFLQITGEDRVQVDRKGISLIQAKLPVRFLILSNIAPRLPDAGGAFASRVMTLQLHESFLGKEDRGLQRRLYDELPGILLWSMEGWDRLRKRGHFVQPPTGREALEELTALSNPTQAFVGERCELDEDAETYTDELFTQWRKWCELEGRSAVGEKSTFVRSLKAGTPGLRKTRPTNPTTGRRVSAIRGIRLLYIDDDDTPKGQRSFDDGGAF